MHTSRDYCSKLVQCATAIFISALMLVRLTQQSFAVFKSYVTKRTTRCSFLAAVSATNWLKCLGICLCGWRQRMASTCILQVIDRISRRCASLEPNGHYLVEGCWRSLYIEYIKWSCIAGVVLLMGLFVDRVYGECSIGVWLLLWKNATLLCGNARNFVGVELQVCGYGVWQVRTKEKYAS